MNKVIIVFLGLCLSFITHGIAEEPSAINKAITSFIQKMESEYSLQEKKQYAPTDPRIFLGFNADRQATIEEARVLELQLIDGFHKMVQELKLEDRLILFKNAQISIDFAKDEKRYHRYDGSIRSVYTVFEHQGAPKATLRYRLEDPYYRASKKSNSYYEEPLEIAKHLHTASLNPKIHEISIKEKEMEQVLDTFEESVTEKTGLDINQLGWKRSENGKTIPHVSAIWADLNCYYPKTQEEARQLILMAAETLLMTINTNKVLTPYLNEYPMTARNLRIQINFKYRDSGWFIRHLPSREMQSVVLENNLITFFNERTEHHIQGSQSIFVEESYEEALKTLALTPHFSLQQSISKWMRDFMFRFTSSLDEILALSLLWCFVYGFWILLFFFVIYTIWAVSKSAEEKNT